MGNNALQFLDLSKALNNDWENAVNLNDKKKLYDIEKQYEL